MVANILWGDLNENGNFKERKLISHGYKIRFSYMRGTILLIEFDSIVHLKINDISKHFRAARVWGRC